MPDQGFLILTKFCGFGSIFPSCVSILFWETYLSGWGGPLSSIPRGGLQRSGNKNNTAHACNLCLSPDQLLWHCRNSAEKRLCVCWKIVVNGPDLGSLKLWTDLKTVKSLLKVPKTPNRRQQILSLAWRSRTNYWWTIPSKFSQNFPKTRKTFYFLSVIDNQSMWIVIFIHFPYFSLSPSLLAYLFSLVLRNNNSISFAFTGRFVLLNITLETRRIALHRYKL